MIYAQPSICPGEWHTQTPMGLWHTNGSSNLGQKTRPYSIQKKKKKKKEKRTCKIVDFAVPADHRIKLKESEKKDNYLDLAWELKKLWNIKVTILLTVIGVFRTVTKGLENLNVIGRVKNIQTRPLLRTSKILRRVLETWGVLLSLKLQWKTISLRWCEKPSRSKHNNIKKDKYLDLARELKKLWNMKVMVVLIVIGAPGTVTKGLV